LSCKTQIDSDIAPEAKVYVQSIINKWLPAPSVVVDIALMSKDANLLNSMQLTALAFTLVMLKDMLLRFKVVMVDDLTIIWITIKSLESTNHSTTRFKNRRIKRRAMR
jgi:hypothetical protein